MPRGKTTCRSVGRPEADWCDPCKCPKLKAKCAFAVTERVGLEGGITCVNEPSAPNSTLAALEPSSSLTQTVDHTEVMSMTREACALTAQTCEECAIDATNDELENDSLLRTRKAPMRFEPEEFWRRELPHEPKDSGTQLERAALRNRERELWIKHIQTKSYDQGLRSADELVKEIREKLKVAAAELATLKEARKKEAAIASEYKRKVEASKRQKTLNDFFAHPLPHDARPRAPPRHWVRDTQSATSCRRPFHIMWPPLRSVSSKFPMETH